MRTSANYGASLRVSGFCWPVILISRRAFSSNKQFSFSDEELAESKSQMQRADRTTSSSLQELCSDFQDIPRHGLGGVRVQDPERPGEAVSIQRRGCCCCFIAALTEGHAEANAGGTKDNFKDGRVIMLGHCLLGPPLTPLPWEWNQDYSTILLELQYLQPLANLTRPVAMDPSATLLFCHGGGFCKEIWDPIIARMTSDPLLQTTQCEIKSFDFSYHGSKRDESVAAQLHMENPKAPRVTHPAMRWVEWAPEEVQRQVTALGERKAPLIGIGHSMGAAALWATEARHPGTFDGLILFEPIYALDSTEDAHLVDFLVSITLRRESKWSSQEQAETHFHGLRNFAAWDRESLAAYLKGALVKDSPTEISLACTPHIEASLYCGNALHLTTEEQGSPKCPVYVFDGARTKLFHRSTFEKLAQDFPHIYCVGETMANTSHLMVLEAPEASATRILDSLAQLTPFKSN